jgi:signal transduction histidine kinase
VTEKDARAVIMKETTPVLFHNESFRQLAILFGAGAALSGILGIVGLYFGITLFSSYKTMAFSAAIIWIFFGSIIALNAERPLEGTARNCVALMIAAIAVMAAIEFSLSILGQHFIFETFFIWLGNALIGYPTTPISPVSVGLIIPTAIALFLLLFIRSSTGRIKQSLDMIGLIGLFVSIISFTFLLSYAYGAPFLYNTTILPMAFMSALGGLFIGFGLMLSTGSDAFPLRYFIGSSVNARLLRTFLPLTLAIIITESYLNDILRLNYNNNSAFWVSVSLVLFSFITVYVVMWAARGLGESLEAEARERKRAEEALQLVNKKLNLLSSITRHDINNQLFSLKVFLELLKESPGDPAQAAEFITKIEQATNAIEHQIGFTRDYEDMGVKAPTWQNVEAAVKEAVAALPMRNVRIIPDRVDLEVYADALFGKVFYNLIDNALRYGGTGMSEIRVSSREGPAGSLIIVVEDNGSGIPADDKPQIFSRGFGKNTGLGLFLSMEILSITGITITENGEPGNGARFEMMIPGKCYRSGNAPQIH